MKSETTALAKRHCRAQYVRNAIAFVAACLIASALGCQSDTDKPPPPKDSNNLRGIIRYYVTATSNLRRPPKNMDELKAVLAGLVDDPSPYFRSTRDGEEYVVVWGLRLDSVPADTIIAYERTGVDGKRMVINRDGVAKEVSKEEFAGLKFPKGHTPEV
jgi:hypothetical protein